MTTLHFREIMQAIHNGIASACAMLPRYGMPKKFYSQAQSLSKDWEAVNNDIKKSMTHFKDLNNDAKKKK